MTAAYLYAATRTPFGKFGGAYADVRPDDLAAAALTGVLDCAPQLDRADIGDVYWGNANGAGEDNRNVGRMAALLAGFPTSVPGVSVNRLCGSSLDAAMLGSRMVETGDADIVLTGGVESMTRAPWVLPKPSRGFPAGNLEAVSTALSTGKVIAARGRSSVSTNLSSAARQSQQRIAAGNRGNRRQIAQTGRAARPGCQEARHRHAKQQRRRQEHQNRKQRQRAVQREQQLAQAHQHAQPHVAYRVGHRAKHTDRRKIHHDVGKPEHDLADALA